MWFIVLGAAVLVAAWWIGVTRMAAHEDRMRRKAFLEERGKV